jgi:hypothetical protein
VGVHGNERAVYEVNAPWRNAAQRALLPPASTHEQRILARGKGGEAAVYHGQLSGKGLAAGQKVHIHTRNLEARGRRRRSWRQRLRGRRVERSKEVERSAARARTCSQ